MKDVRVLIPDVRSVYNVGSIFRTADAVGVSKIYLSGTTPTPLDKYGVPRNDFNKVSLGAEKSVSWEYIQNTKELIQKLKEEGVQIIALEQSEKSILYTEIQTKGCCVLIVGNEVSGIDQEILHMADVSIYIPMEGKKESLNVSVAFGIAIYQLKRS